jgi:predicted dehydrogenase
MDPVRIAVVGLGYWGPNLVRNLQDIPEAEVTWICDIDMDALEKVGRRNPSAVRTVDIGEILAAPEVDAVAIATPVSTHHSLASAALQAGKHVFVEKPLAASSAEAQDLIELAEARGLTLMPGHTFLYSPPVNMVHDLIESGDLGEIYFISTSRVNLGLHQPDVSVIWDLGPHDFSILHYWLGESPSHAAAMTRSCIVPGVPDVAFVSLQYPAGTIAHVELSWLAPSKLRRTAVVGSRKMVVYDDGSNEPVRIFDSGVSLPDPGSFGEYKLSYRTGDIVSPAVPATEPLALELSDFCSSVRTGLEPRSSARLGAEVVSLVEAVDQSVTSGGAPVLVVNPQSEVRS